MDRRTVSHRWIGGISGKRLPMAITGIYLFCGLIWMVIAIRFVHHDWPLILEDSVYIACTAAVLYFLLHLGVSTVRAKESALRESEDRLARILETNASGIVVYDETGIISYMNSAASSDPRGRAVEADRPAVRRSLLGAHGLEQGPAPGGGQPRRHGSDQPRAGLRRRVRHLGKGRPPDHPDGERGSPPGSLGEDGRHRDFLRGHNGAEEGGGVEVPEVAPGHGAEPVGHRHFGSQRKRGVREPEVRRDDRLHREGYRRREDAPRLHDPAEGAGENAGDRPVGERMARRVPMLPNERGCLLGNHVGDSDLFGGRGSHEPVVGTGRHHDPQGGGRGAAPQRGGLPGRGRGPDGTHLPVLPRREIELRERGVLPLFRKDARGPDRRGLSDSLEGTGVPGSGPPPRGPRPGSLADRVRDPGHDFRGAAPMAALDRAGDLRRAGGLHRIPGRGIRRDGAPPGGPRPAGERGEIPEPRGEDFLLGVGDRRQRRLHVRQSEDPRPPRVRAGGGSRQDPPGLRAGPRGEPVARGLRPDHGEPRTVLRAGEDLPAQGWAGGDHRDQRRAVFRRRGRVPGVPRRGPGHRGAETGGGDAAGERGTVPPALRAERGAAVSLPARHAGNPGREPGGRRSVRLLPGGAPAARHRPVRAAGQP